MYLNILNVLISKKFKKTQKTPFSNNKTPFVDKKITFLAQKPQINTRIFIFTHNNLQISQKEKIVIH